MAKDLTKSENAPKFSDYRRRCLSHGNLSASTPAIPAVHDHSSTANPLLTPETKRLLQNRADNQRTLMKLCKLSPDMQEQVARKAANGESREIYDAIAQVHRDKLRARRCSLPLEGKEYRLLHGDFRKVGA